MQTLSRSSEYLAANLVAAKIAQECAIVKVGPHAATTATSTRKANAKQRRTQIKVWPNSWGIAVVCCCAQSHTHTHTHRRYRIAQLRRWKPVNHVSLQWDREKPERCNRSNYSHDISIHKYETPRENAKLTCAKCSDLYSVCYSSQWSIFTWAVSFGNLYQIKIESIFNFDASGTNWAKSKCDAEENDCLYLVLIAASRR